MTHSEKKIRLYKWEDVRGNTVTWSDAHDFWIIDDGKKFFTVSGSQHSIELTHPVKRVLLPRIIIDHGKMESPKLNPIPRI